MISPVIISCVCKSCLEGAFVGQPFARERNMCGSSLRTKRFMKKCPSGIYVYLHNLKVDICLRDTIETLKAKVNEIGESMESSEDEDSEDNDRLQEDCDEDSNVTKLKSSNTFNRCSICHNYGHKQSTCINPLVDGCAPTTSRKLKKRSRA